MYATLPAGVWRVYTLPYPAGRGIIYIKTVKIERKGNKRGASPPRFRINKYIYIYLFIRFYYK
jgi:hypothetical protein